MTTASGAFLCDGGFLHNRGGRFEAWMIGENLRTNTRFRSLSAFDADNDGRADFAVGGASGLAVVGQRADLSFGFLSIADPPSEVTARAVTASTCLASS